MGRAVLEAGIQTETLSSKRISWSVRAMERSKERCWLCAQLWAMTRLMLFRSGEPLVAEDVLCHKFESYFGGEEICGTVNLIKRAGGTARVITLEVQLDTCPGPLRLPLTPWESAEQDTQASKSYKYIRHWTFKRIRKMNGRKVSVSRPYAPQRSHLQPARSETQKQPSSSISDDNTSISTPKRIAQIRSWLEACNSSCNCRLDWEHIPREFLPTRLLQIESFEAIKLVESTSLIKTETLHYATLSHCWGKTPFPTMKRSIYERAQERGQGILLDVSLFTKTFREAVVLCIELSIKYIWIDSWCIVQDDPEDWRRESAQMHLVYGNSSLNIAAAASSESTRLWYPLRRSLCESIAIHLPGEATIIWSSDRCNLESFRLLYEQMPLFSRGWVYQELALAPRTLIMTDVQMFWKCRSEFLREIPPLTAIKRDWKHASIYTFSGLGSYYVIDAAWRKVASDYSRTVVSRSSDRAVALLGLLKKFIELYSRSGTQTRSVVGVWTHNLCQWLAWTADTRASSKASRYPQLSSWSWLSFADAVRFYNDNWTRSIVLDRYEFGGASEELLLNTKLVESDTITHAAHLKLTASIFHLEPKPTTADFRQDVSRSTFGNELPIEFELVSRSTDPLRLKVGQPLDTHEATVEFDIRFDYINVYHWPEEIQCALLYCTEDGTRTGRYVAMMIRILDGHLEPTTGSPLYERLGVVDINWISHTRNRPVSPIPEIRAFFDFDDNDRQSFWLR